MKDVIGRCIGETSPIKVSFVSKNIPAVGEYVYLEYNDKIVLGMIQTLFRGNTTLNEDIMNPQTIERILEIDGDIDHYVKGDITILGDKDNLEIPKIPAPPGTEVIRADSKLLQIIFEKEEGLKLGTLVSQPTVPVRVDINKMVSRHLAILAMTGAGKSNATSIIIDELLKANGSILIFDMHGEYGKTQFRHGQTHIIKPRINPRDLSINEYKHLASIADKAVNQEKYFRDAYNYADSLASEGGVNDFIYTMRHYLKNELEALEKDEGKKRQSHIDAIRQVEFKLEDLKGKYHKILESTDIGDIVNNIDAGKANVINLSSVDETATDIIVNHVLNNILNRRKRAMQFDYQDKKDILEFPIFCIIEEAHMIASEGRKTKSKYIISKIAREGRKFGVGLCLVSQSPKSLDSGTLSQVNNLIILRLVEPGDQAHVQRSSESLSEDLLKQLPSLNTGEAIILGQMTKIPTMVKIDEFKGKHIGNDLDILSLWKKNKEEKETKLKQEKDDFEALF